MTNTNDKWSDWRGWNGGECPVDLEDDIEVVDSDGDFVCAKAGDFYWGLDAKITIIAYRVKREPVVEEVEVFGSKGSGFTFYRVIESCGKGYRITFNTIDGEPDCASIRMEKIGEGE